MTRGAGRVELDRDQTAAVDNPTNPLCIIAPAGSGKTRVLTHRIARRALEGEIDIRRVLAITFTTRAARELEERSRHLLGRDVPTTCTFHALALRMVQDHRRDHHRGAPIVADDTDRLIRQAWPSSGPVPIGTLRTEISWAQATGVRAADFVDRTENTARNPAIDPALIASTYAAYQRAKRSRGVMDFADLLDECTTILQSDAAFARAQRWRHRHFFIDEYQDVSPAQQRLLDALIGDGTDICVVGDPNQAIYGFNGADAHFLTSFTRRFPTATLVELSTNYRSCPEIVRISNTVLGSSTRSGRAPSGEVPTIEAFDDDTQEAVALGRRLRASHLPGSRWREQAVLVRTHLQARSIAEMLTKARIPVRLQGDDAPRDAVEVLSFHSAKGLEWPIVHLAGIEEGLVPDHHALTDDAVAEERRLFHVAAGRAGRRLHMSWARRRRFGDRIVARRPSRWLEPLHEAIDELAPPSAPRTHTTTSIQPTANDVQGAPEAVRDRLEAWRAQRARVAAVPPRVVLSDRTLDDLVRQRPGHVDQLAAVEGLGPVTAHHYGPAIIEIISEESSK